MSQEEKNKQCQICKGYLFEDDDVVICPECGAPHHRDCWNSVGHCGLLDAHGTENQYDKVQQREAEQNNTQDTDVTHTCRYCGRTSKTADAEFCPYCGQAFSDKKQSHGPHVFMGSMPFQNNSFGGIPKNSEIEGVKVKDLATFVGPAAPRYIPRFYHLTKSKRGSWNWMAFFFPAVWNFSRKMYVNGILYLILSVAANLCFIPFGQELSQFLIEGVSRQELYTIIEQNLNSFSMLSIILLFIGAALYLIPRVVCGKMADWSYRCFAIEKVKKIKNDASVENIEETLMRSGSVSLLFLIIAWFLEQYIPMIIQMFIT